MLDNYTDIKLVTPLENHMSPIEYLHSPTEVNLNCNFYVKFIILKHALIPQGVQIYLEHRNECKPSHFCISQKLINHILLSLFVGYSCMVEIKWGVYYSANLRRDQKGSCSFFLIFLIFVTKCFE